MQPMSSMQASLLPGVTPGWNDPPPLGTPGSGSRLNRYRRVVDPSLSAAGGAPSPYAAAASPQQQHGMPPMGGVVQPVQQPMQQQQPAYGMPGLDTNGGYGSPQLLQQQSYGYGAAAAAGVGGAIVQQQPLSQQSSFSPAPPLPPPQQAPSPQQYPYQQETHYQQQVPQPLAHPQPTPPQQPQSMSPYGAAAATVVLSPSQMAAHQLQQQPQQQQHYGIPSSTTGVATPPNTGYGSTPAAGGPYGDYSLQSQPTPLQQHQQKIPEGQEMLSHYNQQQQQIPPPAYSTHQQQPPLQSSSSMDDSNLIFEPPNAVQGNADQRLSTLPDPASYKAPVKVPGDVSLPPSALIAFLVKAAFKLPIAKCQGVQLKMHNLQLQVEHSQLSDKFLLRLNFLVDAIDQEKYEEAASFLETLVADFPAETRSEDKGDRPWITGIRLMLSELRRPNSRMGSANGRPY